MTTILSLKCKSSYVYEEYNQPQDIHNEKVILQ